MIELASHIIDRKKMKFDPSKFEDKYEDALLDLIKAKKAGKKPPVAKPAPKPSNVINLFDALKKSLNSDGGGKAEAQAKAGASAARPRRRSRKAASRKAAAKSAASQVGVDRCPASSNITPSAISASPASRAAARAVAKAKSAGGIFVIQKHDATRLHYDLGWSMTACCGAGP